jgi:hypothetical protein
MTVQGKKYFFKDSTALSQRVLGFIVALNLDFQDQSVILKVWVKMVLVLV